MSSQVVSGSLGITGMLPGGWRETLNIVAYPHLWQVPARTEQWAYEQCLEGLPYSPFSQLVAFPWATLIDLLRANDLRKAGSLLATLEMAPPRKTLVRATVCQHVYAADMLPWFERLKITDLYWPHATTRRCEIDGIRVHPFPLFPVRCSDMAPAEARHVKQPSERKYLYSFIGAYQPGLYQSQVRQWILDLPPRADAHVCSRSQWHYDAMVYQQQIGGHSLTEGERAEQQSRATEYTTVLQDTLFSLCPSGAGPNSIRLWESLGFGCIPVLLADDLRLPGDPCLWDQAVIRVPETPEAVQELPGLLARVAKDDARVRAMVEAGREIWSRYGERGPVTILSELAQPARIHAWARSSPDWKYFATRGGI